MLKGIGKGDDFQVVEVYEVDTGTVKEIRALQQQVAEELGQRVERTETLDLNKLFERMTLKNWTCTRVTARFQMVSQSGTNGGYPMTIRNRRPLRFSQSSRIRLGSPESRAAARAWQMQARRSKDIAHWESCQRWNFGFNLHLRRWPYV